MEKVAIFVDAANIFFIQKKNGWFIDFEKFKEYCKRFGELTVALYYTAMPLFTDVEKISKYRRFKSALIHIGYNVIDKEVKSIEDKTTGKIILKGNLDIELVMGMITNKDRYGVAVLLGGDCDYLPVIKYLRDNGKSVICLGKKEWTSEELFNHINEFIDINSLKTYIEKKK
jgi:uncharacterized LabA/DUF88 family protein